MPQMVKAFAELESAMGEVACALLGPADARPVAVRQEVLQRCVDSWMLLPDLRYKNGDRISYYELLCSAVERTIVRLIGETLAQATSCWSYLARSGALWKRYLHLVDCLKRCLSRAAGKIDIVPSAGNHCTSSVPETQQPTVESILMNAWCEHVLVRERWVEFRDVLIGAIQQMRRAGDVTCAEPSDDEALRDALAMLSQLSAALPRRGLFDELVEARLAEVSRLFFREEAQRSLACMSVAEFLRHAQACIEAESARLARLFEPDTAKRLLSISLAELIETRADALCSEFGPMLAQQRREDAKRLFHLLTQASQSHLVSLAATFGAHASALGRARLAASQEEAAEEDEANGKQVARSRPYVSYVETLLDLADELTRLIEQDFANQPLLLVQADSELRRLLNEDGNRSAEFLSLYLDERMKKRTNASCDVSQAAALFDRCVGELFRRLDEKDLFERYYKQHLARRLLHGRSESVDDEQAMITRLKRESGHAFTHKLEAMFKDIQTSEDLMRAFRTRCASGGSGGESVALAIDFSVKVVTAGVWPLSTSPCALPELAVRLQGQFAAFYAERHSGRSLVWENTQGMADVRALFGPSCVKEMCVTTPQLAILSLFNMRDSYKLEELASLTSLEPGVLVRELRALACARYRVLLKTPAGRKIEAGDSFAVNEAFSCKLFRFTIGSIIAPESERERDKTLRKNDDDRAFLIDAAIVRVMKARKSLDHAALLAEVTKQLQSRFTPVPTMIKRQIEKLIEREYIERDGANNRLYNYLA